MGEKFAVKVAARRQRKLPSVDDGTDLHDVIDDALERLPQRDRDAVRREASALRLTPLHWLGRRLIELGFFPSDRRH